MLGIPIPLFTIFMLVMSNIFMITAWYWHLKYESMALPLVILISWSMAFFEYCFQVPANRYGYGYFSAVQLKVIQEVVTLLVFVGFSTLYLGAQIRWNHIVGFVLLVAAVFVIFKEW